MEQSGGINDVSLYSPESSLVREGVISEMISPLDSVVCVPGLGYKLYDLPRAKIDEKMKGERERGRGKHCYCFGVAPKSNGLTAAV